MLQLTTDRGHKGTLASASRKDSIMEHNLARSHLIIQRYRWGWNYGEPTTMYIKHYRLNLLLLLQNDANQWYIRQRDGWKHTKTLKTTPYVLGIEYHNHGHLNDRKRRKNSSLCAKRKKKKRNRFEKNWQKNTDNGGIISNTDITPSMWPSSRIVPSQTLGWHNSCPPPMHDEPSCWMTISPPSGQRPALRKVSEQRRCLPRNERASQNQVCLPKSSLHPMPITTHGTQLILL